MSRRTWLFLALALGACVLLLVAMVVTMAWVWYGRGAGPRVELEFRAQKEGVFEFSAPGLRGADEAQRLAWYGQVAGALSRQALGLAKPPSVDFIDDRVVVRTRAKDVADVAGQQAAIARLLATVFPDSKPIRGELWEASADDMEQIQQILTERVRAYGVRRPSVTVSAPDKVAVSVHARNPSALRDLLSKTGLLEFRQIPKRYAYDTRGPEMDAQRRPYTFYDEADLATPVPAEQVVNASPVILTGRDLKPGSSQVIVQSGQPTAVSVEFQGAARNKVRDFTRGHVRHYLAIVLDRKLYMAPVIEDALPGSAIIHGGFDGEEGLKKANDLKILLNAGALPFDLELVSESGAGAPPAS